MNSKTELMPEAEIEETNVVPFARLAPGGKGPIDEPSWLKNLGQGSMFLVRKRKEFDPQLYQFIVEGITPKGNYFLLTKPNIEITVDPSRFSSIWELIEVLQTAEEFAYLQQLRQQDEAKEETKGE